MVPESTAPPFVANYDEASIPAYTLPELLRSERGKAITGATEWRQIRRPELLELFRTHVYGSRPAEVEFHVETLESGLAFKEYDGSGSAAVREQLRIRFGPKEKEGAPFIDLLLYRPSHLTTPAPLFLGLNFKGNHSTTLDPAVLVSSSQRSEPSPRGGQSSRWPFELLLSKGFAVATFYYGDAAPDSPEHWREGLARLVPQSGSGPSVGSEPGAVAWWAWALSRALDALSARPEIDAQRVALVGHSRQGKAALWAAAEDERFALVISNNSGCTGAALSRRRIGERGIRINASFPHWFCGNYRSYDEREAELPIDQHQLIALAAPRPVYIASATEDLWADPKGEYLAAVAASPAFSLFGYTDAVSALGTVVPPPDTPTGNRVAYHLRTGKHDITEWDWRQYATFSQRHLSTGTLDRV